jgi:uncharacterized delta-60 repeat protein
MKQVARRLAVAATTGLLWVCSHAGITVNGPVPGFVYQKVQPPIPNYEQMLMNNRLNLQIYFKNSTGQELVFQSGKAVFARANGESLGSSTIDTEDFLTRRRFSSASAFTDGLLTTDVGNFSGEVITAAAFDHQGRIVVAGYGTFTDGIEYAVLGRYLANGNLDDTFDGDGLRKSGAFRASAIAIDNGNGIWVVGNPRPAVNGFNLQHYTASGSPDETRTVDFGNPVTATSVALDSLGRVVVGGWVVVGGAARLMLWRSEPSTSTPDATFGLGGKVSQNLASAAEGIQAIDIDSSDRIVAAGWSTQNAVSQFIVARFRDTNGSLDPGFGIGGVTSTTFPGDSSAQARTLRITSSGRVLVGGWARVNGHKRMAIARFNTDGTPDDNFSGDGRLLINVSTDDEEISSITQDLIGRIIVTGRANDDESERIVLVRFNGLGELDDTFGGDGIVVASGPMVIGGGSPSDYTSMFADAVVTLPNGDFVAAGQAVKDDGSDFRFALARFNPNGSFDRTAAIPKDADWYLELLDFNFFNVWSKAAFAGFDPKRTPERIELQLQFSGFASPFVIGGIEVRPFPQNAVVHRFPLKTPATGQWHSNQAHEFSTHHHGSRSQRFAYDIGNDAGTRPGCDPAAEGFISHYPCGTEQDFDPNQSYPDDDFNECSYSWGAPVFASAPGRVVYLNTNVCENFPVGKKGPGGGNNVGVDHGNGEISRYFHMVKGSIVVTNGQTLEAGDPIGTLGNSGQSTGPHLHFHLQDSLADTADGVPVYFSNVRFPSTSGGPVVLQLRSAIPRDTSFEVDDTPDPTITPGIQYGPGAINEVASDHDSLVAPMRLELPVSVDASLTAGGGNSVADVGDVIEDVYRFTVAQGGMLSVQLYFDAGTDLDVVLYDQHLQAIQPDDAKSLARPELLCAGLKAGTYFLLVSSYDRTTTPGKVVSYRLDVDFHAGAQTIYVNKVNPCPIPGGDMSCVSSFGGPFPTVLAGLNAACDGDTIVIRGATYAEKLTIRKAVQLRSYSGNAIIAP